MATYNSEEEVVGVLPDLLTQAALAVGVTPKYVGYPWKRCLELLKQNKVDATFPSIYLKKREVLGRYPMAQGKEDKSRSLANVDYSIFTSRDNPVQWNGAFSKKQIPIIGAPLGYVVSQSLRDNHNIKANTQFLTLRGLQLVALRRLNGYVVEKLGGEAILRQEELEDKVIALNPPFEKHYWHLMISHKFYSEFPEISEDIWDQIKVQREQNFSKLVKTHSGGNLNPHND
ncbi:MAG: hypothetical protein JKY12_06675 [Sneathiella sp.]|nr:hypothetical protein [Sneathiella sp.]